MSTGAEAAELPNGTVAKAVAETQEITAENYSYSYSETKITLLDIPVRVPEEPVLINGKPFGFMVNDNIAAAVNALIPLSKNSWGVESIEVRLVDSLPEKLTGHEVETGLDRGEKAEETKIIATLPREIVKSDMAEEEIVALAEKSITDDIRRGMEELAGANCYVNTNIRAMKYGALSIGPLVGEGVALATANSDKISELAEKGALGAAIGGLAAGATVLGKMLSFDVRRYPTNAGKSFTRFYRGSHYGQHFAKPLISLVAHESQEPTAEAALEQS